MSDPIDIGDFVIGGSQIEGPVGLVVTGNGLSYADTAGNAISVSASSGRISIKLANGFKLFLGGDGVTGTYSNVLSVAGPSASVFVRVDAP